MNKSKKNYQANVNILYPETKMLEDMMIEDRLLNRSAFVRHLINQEWNRRHQEEVKDAEAEEQERCNE